ncbi:MAG: hypothetical protein JNL58_04655 [Planctomyces sp.]|nr:hypothetical protein [Planctomyces sp.]
MTETTLQPEQFSLEGPIGFSAAIGILLLLLVLFTWSLGRERGILGTRQTILFWFLRATALGVAFWMLLAPTKTLVEVSTTRRSVAVMVDTSGSMTTVDPAGVADDFRWVGSTSANVQIPLITAADSSVAAISLADKSLLAAMTALVQHQPDSLVVDSLSSCQTAITRVRKNLQSVTDAGRLSSEVQGQLAKLDRELSSSEIAGFEELCGSLQKGRTPSDRGWRESLSDLQIRLSAIRKQLIQLSRDIATDEQKTIQSGQSRDLANAEDTSRLDRVAAFLDRLNSDEFETIRERADIRISTFDQEPRLLSELTSIEFSATTDPPKISEQITAMLQSKTENGDDEDSLNSGIRTDLTAVMEQLDRQRRETSLAAAIVLTDAAHNDSGSVNPRIAAASLKGVPVFIVPIGNTQYVRDVAIQSVYCPAVAMRNDSVVIEAVIQAHDCEGETCVVELIEDGQPSESRTIQMDSGYANRRVRFDRKLSDIGIRRFQIRVQPLERELSLLNNVNDFEVNVTRNEIRILLSDEMPRWEYRYLTQLFRRDAKIQLDELLYHPRLVATGRRQTSGVLPESVDDWDQYDVVILGDLTANHFSEASQVSLKQYLQERGGTAIFIAGRESMPEAFSTQPLADILPVTRAEPTSDAIVAESGYAFSVTEEGKAHSALMIGATEEATRDAWAFVNQFAPLPEISPWHVPRPSATTLIAAVPNGTLNNEDESSKRAFLCWHSIGRGRAIYLSGPETFRLRSLRGDVLHYRFWGQMLRWALASDLAAGSEFVRIRTDKTQYSTGESIQVTVRLMDGSGQAVVTSSPVSVVARTGETMSSVLLSPDGQIPGQYVGEFRALTPGEYQLEASGDAVAAALQGADPAIDVPAANFTVRPDLPMELLDTRSDRALAQQIADLTGGLNLPPTAVREVLSLTDLEPVVELKSQNTPLWAEWKYLWIVFGCLQTEWIIRKLRGLS